MRAAGLGAQLSNSELAHRFALKGKTDRMFPVMLYSQGNDAQVAKFYESIGQREVFDSWALLPAFGEGAVTYNARAISSKAFMFKDPRERTVDLSIDNGIYQVDKRLLLKPTFPIKESRGATDFYVVDFYDPSRKVESAEKVPVVDTKLVLS